MITDSKLIYTLSEERGGNHFVQKVANIEYVSLVHKKFFFYKNGCF